MPGCPCPIFISETKCQPPWIPYTIINDFRLRKSAVSLVCTESKSHKDSSCAAGPTGSCLLLPFYPLGHSDRLSLLFSISVEPSEAEGQSLPFHLLILTVQDYFFQ